LETTAAIEAVATQVASISAAIESASAPGALDWWTLGVNTLLAALTLVAVGVAVRSAVVAGHALREARRSADAALKQADISASALAHDQIVEFRSEFDEWNYFIRFWRLDMLTRDLTGVKFGATRLEVAGGKHDLTESKIGPAAGYGLHDSEIARKAADLKKRLARNDLEQILHDAFGPESSPDRADLVALYWFALKVFAFAEGDIGESSLEITRVFGVQLLSALSRHRLLAARLVPLPSRKNLREDYYGRAYGLYDENYAELLEALFEAAQQRGLIKSHEVDKYRQRESLIASLGYHAAKI